MLRLATIAVLGALSAVGVARGVYALDHPPAESARIAPATAPAEVDAGSGASLLKSPDGHYWADADVDGHTVRLLVDTGSSAVALTPEDAEALGFPPSSLNYEYQVATAGGQARAAKITLGSVSVTGAEVRDVDAYVIEHGLPASLLGMSYLGRLSRFEATPTSLVLRQ